MDNRKPKNQSKTNNPFSFRNFLTSNNNDSSINHSHNSDSTMPTNNVPTSSTNINENPYSFSRFIQSNDFNQPVREDPVGSIQSDLPDFVQDQIGSSNEDFISHSSGLPDFTRYTSSANINSHRINSENHITHRSNSADSSLSNNTEDIRVSVSQSANLPDFLSDTGLSLGNNPNDLLQHTTQSRIPDIPIGASNHSLTNGDELSIATQISVLEEEIRQKNSRISSLEQQLIIQKRKEEEETEMMENIMRQVDENLQNAVERWRIAETEVERLSNVIVQLESQLNRSTGASYNSNLGASNSNGSQMHLVRDLGMQLGSNLIVADKMLKQLLEHSDKIKLLAGHLQYLDRVEEIDADDSSSNQANNNKDKSPKCQPD